MMASNQKGPENVVTKVAGVTENVTAIVKKNLEEIVVCIYYRHLARALREIRAANEDRMNNLEEKCAG